MPHTKRPVNSHRAYHAHVYFDQESPESTAVARRLRDAIAKTFDLSVGRFHERPIGPHPTGSFQVTFRNRDFDRLIPWLDAHREGLSVLIHPLTRDHVKDHTDDAAWLGDSVALNLGRFRRAT